MKVKCQHCGYEWDTSSTMDMVTCPSCGYKTPRSDEITAPIQETSPSNSGKKVTTGVRNLETKWIGALVAVVVVIAGAFGAYVYMGGEGGAGGEEGGAATISLAGTNLAFAGPEPPYSGIENIYIVENTETDFTQDFGGGSQPASVMTTLTSTADSKEISPDTSFYVVLAVKASSSDLATNEIAYVSLDNLYGYHSWTGGDLSGSENTDDTGNEYIFDNSAPGDIGTTIGWLEANLVFTNGGSGWSLPPDGSASLTDNYYMYTE